MIYEALSEKQLSAMFWWSRPETEDADAVICDGAVRSGKTMSVTMGFLLWSMSRFSGQAFGICGKTLETLRRNILFPMQDWTKGLFTMEEKRSESRLTLRAPSGRENTYFLFGGKDETSYTQIQGVTLAGVLLDEVVLMPRSFVEQACARCSVPGAKLWFSCNPEGEEHWFYREWICRREEKHCLYLHFTMEDNPALTGETLERYRRLYTGLFYRRYVLGEWCRAEGLVYDLPEGAVTDEVPTDGRWFISVDYGTMNPFSAGLWCLTDREAVRVREFYYDGRAEQRTLTDEEYYRALERLAGDHPIEEVIADPSAASFIAVIRRHGRFHVRRAKNEVLDGIRWTDTLLHSGRVRIHKSCTDALREFRQYRWEEDRGEGDRPVKEHDHAMDEIRYFCRTVLVREFGECFT